MNASPQESLTFYEILQVSPNASQAEIRKAYLKLSLKFHPDKNPNNVEEAKEQFIRIGKAYEVLSDPIQRQSYDRELVRGGGIGGAGTGSGTTGSTFFNSNFYSSTGTGESTTEATYESYRQAFDAHMANLSEDDLNTLKSFASVIGSIVGTVYGSKLAGKLGGNSKVGRALFETAGSLVGSVVGSQAGTNLVSTVHTQSLDRLTYEEKKRVAQARGEPIPERPKGNNNAWDTLRRSLDKSINDVMKNQTKSNDRY